MGLAEKLFHRLGGLDVHHAALVVGNAHGQHIHGPLQVLLLQHISNPNFIDALAGGFIEGRAGVEVGAFSYPKN